MSRRSLAVVSLLVAAPALTGCASAAVTPRSGLPLYAAPAPPAPPSPDQTFAELARVRHLPLGAPVPIDRVDDDTFLRTYHASTARSVRPGGRAAAFWGAFAMSDASTDVNAVAKRIVDADLDGFYDPRTKRLYVRERATPSAPGTGAFTLAHEEEHALQDRFFGIPDFLAAADDDEALALRALYEGDASVAAALLEANRKGTTSAEAVARLARLVEDDPLLLHATPVYETADVPPLLRAEILWPYLRGTTFVAQLAASGGFSLVDAALRNPPKTTEQVLHVEKYVAGEGAVEVRAPAAPEGYALVETGKMGELQTRFLLAQCEPNSAATEAARGWGGDAYAVAAAKESSDRALLWSTVWDDESAAARFAIALEGRRSCARTGPKPDFTVVRRGARVAFVQGMASDALRAREGASLLELVGSAPPALPPVGAVKLRPRPPVANDFAQKGTVGNGKFSAPLLGFSADLTGLRPVRSPLLELSAVGAFVGVDVAFSLSPPSAALEEETVAAFVTGLRKKNATDPVFDEGTRPIRLSWTTASARTLRLGQRLEMRIALAPACQGKMTFVLVSAWKPGTFGAVTADTWLRSAKADESSPACEALKTLRDPGEEPR